VIGDNEPLEEVIVHPSALYSLGQINESRLILSVNLTDQDKAVSLMSAYTDIFSIPLITIAPSKFTTPVSHIGASADNIVLPTFK
jgi:hypothetical protein